MYSKERKNTPEISIILPCRNEEAALDYCLKQIKEVIEKHKLSAEIIVSDSSSDNSPNIARKHGVKLIRHNKEGYGIACLEGFSHVRGEYIFIADADGTYDFSEIPRFIAHLKSGYDFIQANRMGGKIFPGAMPWHHRYIGNPMLSYFLRLFFRVKIHDYQAGMRAIRRRSLNGLNLQAWSMEFNSEIFIKSFRNNLKIKEIPINYYPRKGKSKLRSFRDGWRNFRFMLIYSPLYLFFLPGLTLFFLGAGSMVLFYLSDPKIFEIAFYFHPMFLSSFLMMIGYQLIIFSLFFKVYAVNHLGEKSPFMVKFFRFFNLEKAIFSGGLLILTGLAIVTLIFSDWIKSEFPSLNEAPNLILSLTFIVLGVQTIFSAFMISILSIKLC